MTTKLFIKDIKLLIRDLKFQIFFVILFALFIVSAISSTVSYNDFAEEYRKQYEAYQKKIQDNANLELQTMIQPRQSITAITKPSPSVLFTVNDNFPIGMTNGVMFYEPILLSGPITTEAFRINWKFILSIMMSFILLILSFESVSGEKRAGTLRLLSIYGFKRQTILWSKFLSYMILYVIIIAPSALISLILFFSLTGTWDVSYMFRFIMILLLSIPFASFFIFLGMFISTLKNYRNAIVVVVSVWLLVVIIIPQSANIFGERISPIKTNSEYMKEQNETWKTEWQAWIDEHGAAVAGAMDITNGLRPKSIYSADEKRNLLRQQRLNDENRQWQTIRNIARVSPFTQFEEIAEIILDNGAYLYTAMQQTMRNALAQIRNIILEQDSRDQTSMHAFFSGASGVGTPFGMTAFSTQTFEQPGLLFISDIQTDDAMNKTMKIILKLLPIIILNLILIIGLVIKLERLDIR